MFSHVQESFLKKSCFLTSAAPLRPNLTSLWWGEGGVSNEVGGSSDLSEIGEVIGVREG